MRNRAEGRTPSLQEPHQPRLQPTPAPRNPPADSGIRCSSDGLYVIDSGPSRGRKRSRNGRNRGANWDRGRRFTRRSPPTLPDMRVRIRRFEKRRPLPVPGRVRGGTRRRGLPGERAAPAARQMGARSHRALEAARAGGRGEEIVPLARSGILRHPLHDKFHYQLIQALLRSGNRTEAVRAYREYEEICHRELRVLHPGASKCSSMPPDGDRAESFLRSTTGSDLSFPS